MTEHGRGKNFRGKWEILPKDFGLMTPQWKCCAFLRLHSSLRTFQSIFFPFLFLIQGQTCTWSDGPSSLSDSLAIRAETSLRVQRSLLCLFPVLLVSRNFWCSLTWRCLILIFASLFTWPSLSCLLSLFLNFPLFIRSVVIGLRPTLIHSNLLLAWLHK